MSSKSLDRWEWRTPADWNHKKHSTQHTFEIMVLCFAFSLSFSCTASHMKLHYKARNSSIRMSVRAHQPRKLFFFVHECKSAMLQILKENKAIKMSFTLEFVQQQRAPKNPVVFTLSHRDPDRCLPLFASIWKYLCFFISFFLRLSFAGFEAFAATWNMLMRVQEILESHHKHEEGEQEQHKSGAFFAM